MGPLTPARGNGRKRAADEVKLSKSNKKQKGSKATTSSAITDVAASVLQLASAFAGSGGSGSPERRKAAIDLIEEDGELSEHEEMRIFKLIRKDVTVADCITSIQDKAKRTRYIHSELEDL